MTYTRRRGMILNRDFLPYLQGENRPCLATPQSADDDSPMTLQESEPLAISKECVQVEKMWRKKIINQSHFVWRIVLSQTSKIFWKHSQVQAQKFFCEAIFIFKNSMSSKRKMLSGSALFLEADKSPEYGTSGHFKNPPVVQAFFWAIYIYLRVWG